jgi:subtilisin family serine protease
LEDRTVPDGGLGHEWILQVDGLTGAKAEQVQTIQQRLDALDASPSPRDITATRPLGLDGLVLVRSTTDISYAAMDERLSKVSGFRYVRSNFIGKTPIFSFDSSADLRPAPGDWVVSFDGMTGSRAAQEEQLQFYLDSFVADAWVLRQLGRDGVFVIRTAPDPSLAELEKALSVAPGYRSVTPNTIGWVASFLPTDPSLLRDEPARPGEWMAQFDDVTGYRLDQPRLVQERLEAAGVANVTVVKPLGTQGLMKIRTDPARSYENLHRALQAVPGYREVEPNYIIQAAAVPNDPLFGQQYGLTKINAPGAWDATTGNSNVVVAVLDSGIVRDHPDLAANVWHNPGEGPLQDGIDDDHNGYVDDYYGWTFIDNYWDNYDNYGHGTLVSGVIGAKGNNGVGVTGVAQNVQIMALEILGADGNGDSADAVDALDYVKMMRLTKGINIKLTNNSWSDSAPIPQLAGAMQRQADAGILFVASAGNAGRNIDTGTPSYPASYTFPNIIAVAATDSQDQMWAGSNYGAASVDLAAPGVAIWSTIGFGYNFDTGTSLAAPFVAGTAALLWSKYPNATYQEVRDAIIGGIDPISLPGTPVRTNGRLNAYNALQRPDRDVVVTAPDAGGGPHVKVFYARPQVSNLIKNQFMAYVDFFYGGVTVAAGDINGDGVPDIITGTKSGGGEVKVFDGTGKFSPNQPLWDFLPYDSPGSPWTGGVFVASADVNGDGRADVITGAGPGGGPHVKVYSGVDGSQLMSFLAYPIDFLGGVAVAAGDINADGKADVITGPGPGGGAHVKVFSGAVMNPPLTLLKSFFAWDPGVSTNGLSVGYGNVNGDGYGDVLVSLGPGNAPTVRAFSGAPDNLKLKDFNAFPNNNGVRVAGLDANGDGKDDIVAAQGPGQDALVSIFSGVDLSLLSAQSPYLGTGVGINVGARRGPHP